jgi:hypothetical protein
MSGGKITCDFEDYTNLKTLNPGEITKLMLNTYVIKKKIKEMNMTYSENIIRLRNVSKGIRSSLWKVSNKYIYLFICRKQNLARK